MTPPAMMTKGRAALPATVVAEQDPFFVALGRPKAHDSSGRDDNSVETGIIRCNGGCPANRTGVEVQLRLLSRHVIEARGCLRVAKERFEAVVHMLLYVAVE